MDYIREVPFEDNELSALLNKKNKIVKQARKLADKMKLHQTAMQRLEAEAKKLGEKLDPIKAKVIELSKPYEASITLGEYEEVGSVIAKGRKVVYLVINKVEQFKDLYKQQKNKLCTENTTKKK